MVEKFLKLKYKIRNIVNLIFLNRLLNVVSFFCHYIREQTELGPITYAPNTSIGRSLYFQGIFEKNELMMCSKFIHENSIVLDIGANIGLHTCFFSNIAKDGLIFSFEPSRETYKILLDNVCSLKNVIPVNFGLFSSNQLKDFFQTFDNAYSSFKDTKRVAVKSVNKVLSVKLDDFLPVLNLSRIDFIKMDVEGLEQDVLEGMEQLITQYKPIIFCEIYKGSNSNAEPERTINFLIGKGYRALVLQETGLVKYELHNDNYYNYFFLPT